MKHIDPSRMFKISIYSLLVVTGQSAATLLGRLYYEKGGKSKYIAALVQSAGFPILFPLLYVIGSRKKSPTVGPVSLPKNVALPALYTVFGTLLAVDCVMYAVGLMYLPVSTYFVICASQLGFNAFFSYFLNSQKLTPFVLNSILLLTVSPILLAFQPESTGTAVNGNSYALGIFYTLAATAGYALITSLQQFAYGKVLQRPTLNEILKVIFYESMVTSAALLVALFASGEWRCLRDEMEGYELGRRGYAATVACAALAWQVFAVGMVSLVLKVSSLFGNVISTLNVPVAPVIAIPVFGERMSGLKAVAMLLTVWGCASYVYQQYLDDLESRAQNSDSRPRNGDPSSPEIHQ